MSWLMFMFGAGRLHVISAHFYLGVMVCVGAAYSGMSHCVVTT